MVLKFLILNYLHFLKKIFVNFFLIFAIFEFFGFIFR